jgi:glycosyltransferase involved in cell wall biosynthesis
MPRGVDTALFTPAKRQPKPANAPLTLGFVGRLSIEKNVHHLVAIHDELLAQGFSNFRFLIIGHGDEDKGLRERMTHADFPGVLRGEALAEAYASMDLFVFPSHTDTFGNVVLEALASGVPAIVTSDGGPRYIVQESVTGHIVSDEGFTGAITDVLTNPARHAAMRQAARAYALTASWDAVFEGVYTGYQTILPAYRELIAAAS